MTRITTLYVSLCTYVKVPCWIILKLQNIIDEICIENQGTLLMLSAFFRKSCRVFNNDEKYCRAGGVTEEYMTCLTTFACWIARGTDSNSDYVIITTFQLQESLQGSASNLREHFVVCILFDAAYKLYGPSYISCSIEVTANLILPHKSTNNF
jgi:hypothetical protein